MIYSKSWLPGMSLVGNREEFYAIGFCLFILLLGINFRSFLKANISIPDLSTFLIALLLLAFLISTFVYNGSELTSFRSLSVMFSYSLIICVFYFLLPPFFFQNNRLWLFFMKSISIFGFMFAVLGAFILVFNLAPVGKWGFAMVSIIGHPNNTSIVFTISFMPTLYIIYWKWKEMTVFQRTFYIASLLVQLVSQLFTFTRAGMIATAAGLLIFLFLIYRSKIILILPVFLGVIPIFVLSFFQAKGFGSFISRLYLLVPAYEMITESREKMLWGYGITNAFKEYGKRVSLIEEYIKDPHNTYVTLLLMFGLIFTAVLLVFVFNLLLKTLLKAIKKKQVLEIRLLYIFLFSSAVSILLQGIFDAELIKYDYFTIHYLLLLFGIMYLTTEKVKAVSKGIELAVGLKETEK